jgi:tripartite-type tricarboxylate transporter receptor subunit TctC
LPDHAAAAARLQGAAPPNCLALGANVVNSPWRTRWNQPMRKPRHAFAVCLIACAATPARADDVADFYRGKTLSIVVGYGPGGGYDLSARALAKHLGAKIPGNPAVVVRNMPGAGSALAMNYMSSTAPRDGTYIGSANDAMLTAALMKLPGVQFDPRESIWLGSIASRGTPIVYARTDGPAKTFAEARRNEVLIGATGPDATSAYALMLNELLGSKFKVVLGYKGGTAEINLAIARGEVHGRASLEWESLKLYRPEWVANNFVSVLIQMGLKPHPELGYVPSAFDLASTEEQRQVMELVLGTGPFLRAYSAPPGTPPERVAALRAALERTVADPDFSRDMSQISALSVEYTAPAAIEAYMARVYQFPRRVVETAAKFSGQ